MEEKSMLEQRRMAWQEEKRKRDELKRRELEKLSGYEIPSGGEQKRG